MRRSEIKVLLVGRQTEELELHVEAMRRHRWRAEIVDPSRLFSSEERARAVVIDQSSIGSTADAFKLATRARVELSVPVVVLSTLRSPEIGKAAQASGCICVTVPCRGNSLIAGITSALAMAGAHWRDLTRPR